MTEFIRPEFTSGTLLTFIGYHFQIFAAGRAKISLQTVTNKKKKEFYTARPKKDRAAYQRQKARSLAALPDHYAVVDRLLADVPDAKIFRLHEKGNNNATADNAHLLASLDQATLWLVMSGVVHRWQLNTMLVHVLLEGKGNRTGEASIFNEYIYGGNGYDYIDGGLHDDQIWGGNWADKILGNSGNDILRGGAGADGIWGGTGNDTIVGGTGDDYISGGSGRDKIYGGPGRDKIFGMDDDDIIYGRDGADTIWGNSGNDRIYGEEDNDIISGGTGDDYISGSLGHDTLNGGSGADVMNGGDGNDQLFGEDGNDQLYGSLDTDQLDGGAGDDQLWGGPGRDQFIFSEGRDSVQDFEQSYDRISLNSDLWDGALQPGDVLFLYGSITGDTAIIDFQNGNVLTINGVTDYAALGDLIDLF